MTGCWWVGNGRKSHSSSLIEVFSANTEYLIGSVPDADPVDVDLAVQAAGQARPLRLTHDTVSFGLTDLA